LCYDLLFVLSHDIIFTMNTTNTPKVDSMSTSYEDMMKAGVHFGRRRSVSHPNMRQYVHTLKENISIIDLIKTTEAVEKVTAFLRDLLIERKNILFVAPNRQSAESIERLAKKLNMPYVLERWLGGTLTNFKTILNRVNYMEALEKEQKLNGFERYTKKERVLKEKEIEKLKKKFDGLRNLKTMPDVVFVSSLRQGALPIHEAKLMKVKTVAISNTDSNPNQVDMVIPANDNAKRSIDLIISLIEKGLES